MWGSGSTGLPVAAARTALNACGLEKNKEVLQLNALGSSHERRDTCILFANFPAVWSASTRAEALHSSVRCSRPSRARWPAASRSPRAQVQHGRTSTYCEHVNAYG